MAAQARRSPASVERDFLQRPQAYSFIQAIRLLKLRSGQTSGKKLQEFFADTLRVRPELSLGFPGSDVCELKKEEVAKADRYQITVSFMGLYGSSSPLPTFYTEELLAEAREDLSGLRDFLDIFNNNFFIKLYKTWARHRLAVRIVEEEDQEALERAFCLIGLGHESLREQFEETYQALRYAGLYTQHPRSALGLQTLLSDRLGGIPVQIKQCQPQKLSVPEDQLLCLGQQGHALGEDTVLGCQIVEHMNKIGIEVGPLDAEQFQSLMPGSSLHKAIEEHVSLFCIQTLAYDLTLLIGRGEKQTTTLGAGRWSSLGWQTWLFSGPSQAPGAVTFTKN
ncbi:MAG: type VI secretion system baseplate subunit TssG [Thermodesulfobacteriota bacterium]